MNNELITAKWFKRGYKLTEDGWMLPILNSAVEYYDPFKIYWDEGSLTDELYLMFANLDIKKIDEIHSFYLRFGPLGIMSRELGNIYVVEGGEDEPLGFDIEGMLLSLTEGALMYRFDASSFLEQYELSKKLPELIELQVLSGEEVESFKWEQAKFAALLNLYISIEEAAIESIKRDLTNFHNVINNKPIHRVERPVIKSSDNTEIDNITDTNLIRWWDEKNDEAILSGALEELMGYLNKEIADRPRMKLIFDYTLMKFSKVINWSCESLLNAMYIMFINNIAEGVQLKSCIHCDKYFRVGRPEMKYCGMSCQNKAKMKRYNDQIKSVQEMHKDGLTPAQIAKETGKSLEQIEKWIAMGKE